MAGPVLNAAKIDAIGEIHNITMGSAAIAVSNMISSTVTITTPQVTVCKAEEVVGEKFRDVDGGLFKEGQEYVYVKINYTKGIEGTSLLVLDSRDVQTIVNKLMGMDPEPRDDFVFDEMSLSAVSEVMNQMMGASATSMSKMLETTIDISPPEAIVSKDHNSVFELQGITPDDTICAVAFDLSVDDIMKSKFINLLSVDLADSMAKKMLGDIGVDGDGNVLGGDDSGQTLTEAKRDAIGELENMSMGSAATALSNFMNAKVWITTPEVSVQRAGDVSFDDLDPSICIKIQYIQGILGSAFLVLKQADVQLMVNQLMGMQPVVSEDFQFDEMSISAVCEIMNQMMGASATTISEILCTPTDISPPEATVIDEDTDILTINSIDEDETVCVVSFDLTIDEIMKSRFVTMLGIDLANQMADKMLETYMMDGAPLSEEDPEPVQEPEQIYKPEPAPAPASEPKPEPEPVEIRSRSAGKRRSVSAAGSAAKSNVVSGGSPAARKMNVQEYSMDSFYEEEEETLSREQYRNLRPLLDVPMEVSVRIGQAQKRIEEVSDFTKGTIIELDTMANEPVDIMVNGNLMARGEVVVVDDNFAVRITEIVNK